MGFHAFAIKGYRKTVFIQAWTVCLYAHPETSTVHVDFFAKGLMSNTYTRGKTNMTSSYAHSAEPPENTSNDAQKELFVIKRDGKLAPYKNDKIAVAITKAILAAEGHDAPNAEHVKQLAEQIVESIGSRFDKLYPSGGSINIEDIQDQVELGLMRQGMQKVARTYVLYREEHAQKRRENQPNEEAHPHFKMVKADGSESPLNIGRIRTVVANACEGLEGVDSDHLLELSYRNLYHGIKESDISTALIMAARPLIESEPHYSYVSARLLLDALFSEVSETLELVEPFAAANREDYYSRAFKAGIHYGIQQELIHPQLAAYDLDELAQAIDPERDLQFNYLGLQTLYDRYFIHHDEARIELPQTFFMRVAMGLAMNEDQPGKRAIEFYRLLSSFDYMSSTPTLFNSGTLRPQLSSCYLTSVPDDLSGIYDALRDNALLSKWAGGLGNDWTNVRALGAHIKGTNGQSQGVVPFLKVVNDTAVAVNQGGKRKGAVCAYLESWHLDIEDFLDLRKNTGDERRRTHDMNTANWIPDLFMKRVFEEKEWTLFSPNDVSDLHELSGKTFEQRYEYYEEQTESGEIKLFKRIPAVDLWRKMLSMLFETGHPWITFKDPCNLRSPQQHVGVVHSSNLCTEITLNTSEDEIAVCNLGSINLVNHIQNGELNREQLQHTVRTAIRMLDNVIDINYYACPQAERSNLRHRPIGLGIMGFQDALYKLDVPYASKESVFFADQSMELISFLALQTSSELAKERGRYESYEGSLWDQGILPIDSLYKLSQERGEHYTVCDFSQTLDWQSLRSHIKEHGLRNSNVMAIAPTATISNIIGVSQSIEPTYQNLFVKSNLSGEFTVVNPWLVAALKKEGLWDAAMVNDLKYYDGSVKGIERIPAHIKQLFSTAFEIEPHWLVEAAARRQKWIDQAQSLNLYMSEPSGKKLDNLYKTAWSRGLKTTYYLRSLGATHTEKNSTPVDPSSLAQQQPDNESAITASREQRVQKEDANDFELAEGLDAPKMCSILEPDCEACQ